MPKTKNINERNDGKIIQDLLEFLKTSPTAWHAVENVVANLKGHGFEELNEGDAWKIKAGGRYYVTRNGSTLCAFTVPSKAPSSIKIAGSHTDSPAFKLKPNAEFRKENMIMFGVEIYGAPLLTSWLNRDLGIAGRVVYKDKKGRIQTELVTLDKQPLVIPQLAIHLDRNVNENGLVLNKQDHITALAALDDKPEKKNSYLETLLRDQVDYTSLLGFDLFLYPIEAPRLLGDKGQMFSAYRIDSLGSVHAIVQGMLQSKKKQSHQLNMIVFWDNEEIGSGTAQGAGSPFLPQLLERITIALGLSRESYFRLLNNALCVSVDLAHALHPNYPDKLDPRHQPLINKGVVLKTSAQHRYASDAKSSAIIVELCGKHGLPLQKFASRGDIPSGTTIGPIHASLTGMPTVDIGCAQLSMHSCRELAGCQDHLTMCKLIAALFE